MPDIVLELDGKEVTVPAEDLKLPDGYKLISDQELGSKYVERSSIDSTHVLKAEFDRRFKNWTPIDEAHKNEAVVGRVLEEHHKDVPDLDEAKKAWESGNLKPLQSKYDGLKSSLVKKDILASAKGIFDDVYTSPPPTGGNTWVENALESRYEFNEDYGYTVTVLNGSPVQSSNPTAKRPYRSVEEDMALLIKEDSWKSFAKKPPKGGGGSGNPGDGSSKDDPALNGKRLDEMTDDEIVAAYGKVGSEGLFKIS